MAINQQITTLSGVTVEYHRISEAMIDYTNRKATIVVLSYLGSAKRDEEKVQATDTAERDAIMKELDELVMAYDEKTDTPELKARRVELSNQINAMPQLTPDDVAPRNIFMERHEIDLPDGVDFTLKFAYGWLKENIYKEATDC